MTTSRESAVRSMKNAHGRSTVIRGRGGRAAAAVAVAAAVAAAAEEEEEEEEEEPFAVASCALRSAIALPTAAALTFSTSDPMSRFLR